HPTVTAPTDPKAYKNHRSKDKFAIYALADIESVQFAQEVVVRDTMGGGLPPVGSADPNSPKPHWRRGHWRSHAHGPALSLRKRILIRPVFVKSHAFKGDISQTSVSIRR